jgi:Na+/H+-translocating membrane pyrophosphatase
MGVGALALVVALFFYARVKAAPEGNEAMARIARYIREGAMAFLVREYKVLAVYAVVFASARGRARREGRGSPSSPAPSCRCSRASSG